MSARKRFDKELYEKNDQLAKQKIIDLLGKKYKVQENPKRTQVDLLVFKGKEHRLCIETEIKRVWKGKNFQYETVQIPSRKEKYATLDKPTLFVMFNEDQTSYLVIKSSDLLASPKVEVPNKYVYKGELFFQVPINKVSFNNLKEVIEEVLNDK